MVNVNPFLNQLGVLLKRIAFLLFAIMLCTLPGTSLGDIVALTNNLVDDRLPKIHKGEVVWKRSDGYRWQIFLHNGDETIQLIDNDMLNIGPQIDNGQVVWMSHYMFAYSPLSCICSRIPCKQARIFQIRICCLRREGRGSSCPLTPVNPYKLFCSLPISKVKSSLKKPSIPLLRGA